MDDVFSRFPALFGRPTPGAMSTADWSPSVDISETDGEFILRAALPAVQKEDVSVTFEDGMLTLSGERRQRQEEKDEKFHKVESFYGSFMRTFLLPDAIDAEAIRAESKDGVLTVYLPKSKAEAKKPATIKVQ
jgi:HSP20 family protein